MSPENLNLDHAIDSSPYHAAHAAYDTDLSIIEVFKKTEDEYIVRIIRQDGDISTHHFASLADVHNSKTSEDGQYLHDGQYLCFLTWLPIDDAYLHKLLPIYTKWNLKPLVADMTEPH